jgi:anion-transporting  ArsA/GET3 family ATPase
MPGLLERDTLFVTGKGGVGRTTVCAALALVAARRGRRTIVCEIGDQHRLPALFGRAGAHGSETALAENLWATSVDPFVGLRDYLASQVPGPLARVLADSKMFRYVYAAAPGARELITLGGIWDLTHHRLRKRGGAQYDTVIVDAPATGHALAMLRTPRVFADIARVGPMHSQAERLWGYVTDPALSGYVTVALAAEMPVNETLDLEGRLQAQLGRDVELIVANGLYPKRFSSDEVASLSALDGSPPVAAAVAAAARSQAARVRGQQAQLRRLRRDARAPVTTLPYLFAAEVGLDGVHQLADALERAV